MFLGPHWGLACFIEGAEKTILFDTGANGQILQDNIDSLGIDVGSVDMVVISHNHPDHLGGLTSVLQRTSGAQVFFGMAFSEALADARVTVSGVKSATPVRVGEPVEVCNGVYVTGDHRLGNPPEQSLILDTQQGLVVITGCAHPGTVNTVKRAQEILGREVYMAVGGFHLLEATPGVIEKTIQELRSLGVKKVAPAHCTGDEAMALFKEAYGQDFIPMGVGQSIELAVDLGTAVAEEEVSAVPHRFVLEQNYPNPFNSDTVIQFSLPQSETVELALYNLAGQQVATLAQGAREAGVYRVRWDGKDDHGRALTSGVYFYRLQAGAQVKTRKLLLLR